MNDQFGLGALIDSSEKLLYYPNTVFPQTSANIINLLVVVAGVIAVIFALKAGSDIVGAFGNEEKVASAKKTLMYVAIGLAVVIFSVVILTLAATLVKTGRL